MGSVSAAQDVFVADLKRDVSRCVMMEEKGKLICSEDGYCERAVVE